MTQLFSAPMTRAEIAALVPPLPPGASKRAIAQALTDYIRGQKRAGKLMARRIFIDPAKNRRKRTVYLFVATNLPLQMESKG
ncbi:hypothetical protein [Achromobacter sp. 2789STDY5608628]|uniref:hypothetical protein n=1 Tax=Achromobacter sp. 2789STDY5608628 TaxID=1806493 RepID=UPI0006C0FAC7|nr:hypothetical protein [Achromobacter sp. 2789STDY5608628]CUJ80939.1 Uncharacterised protein [Achromobacter sp. 2789STDY5608628]